MDRRSPDADLLTTTDAAELLGVSAATVKRWAIEGLLPSQRTPGGHRRFHREDVERLVRPIEPATADERERWIELLAAPSSAPLAVDGALLTARSAVDSWCDVAEALSPVVIELRRRHGEQLLTTVEMFGAASRLGRAAARVSDALPLRADAPRVLLATAEGERHTLGLSLAELCFREAGWSTTWAGNSTSVAELERAASTPAVSAIALSATEVSGAEALASVARRVAHACQASGVALVFCGVGPWPDSPPHGARARTFADLRVWIARSGAAPHVHRGRRARRGRRPSLRRRSGSAAAEDHAG